MENSPRLMVELVWEDADLEELAIVADNGQYRGVATAYFGRGDVALMANALRGFPKLISQREIFSGGSEEADNSFAQLVFYCTDEVGHAAIDVTLSECLFHQGQRSSRNRVELQLRFEPGAIDAFVSELDAIARRLKTKAVLAGIAAQQIVGPEPRKGKRKKAKGKRLRAARSTQTLSACYAPSPKFVSLDGIGARDSKSISFLEKLRLQRCRIQILV